MATVRVEMSMSLDGFIADPYDGVGDLFEWYNNGPVTIPAVGSSSVFRVSEASATHVKEGLENTGAVVSGRRTFDLTNGYEGGHPYGVPIFVVTHKEPEDWTRTDEPITFVTDGVASAVAAAKEVAGDRCVAVGAADVAQQAIDAGLVDEIVVNLVPVLMGKGIRFFDNLTNAPMRLEDPKVIEGDRVTHLYYRVTPPA